MVKYLFVSHYDDAMSLMLFAFLIITKPDFYFVGLNFVFWPYNIRLNLKHTCTESLKSSLYIYRCNQCKVVKSVRKLSDIFNYDQMTNTKWMIYVNLFNLTFQCCFVAR